MKNIVLLITIFTCIILYAKQNNINNVFLPKLSTIDTIKLNYTFDQKKNIDPLDTLRNIITRSNLANKIYLYSKQTKDTIYTSAEDPNQQIFLYAYCQNSNRIVLEKIKYPGRTSGVFLYGFYLQKSNNINTYEKQIFNVNYTVGLDIMKNSNDSLVLELFEYPGDFAQILYVKKKIKSILYFTGQSDISPRWIMERCKKE